MVDDGSADPSAVRRAAAAAGAQVVARPVNGGPAAARNTGLAAARTPLVAFLDSDCVPAPGWLDALLPHFADPAVGAAAPRIVPHEAGRTWLARYEGASSTLDMGQRPSIVRPGSRVPYVPGAALVVRRAAAGAGFAEDMQVGEDVDFVLAARRRRLAGALRARGRDGSPAPGAAAPVVRPAQGLRDVRGRARAAAPRHGPPALRVGLDRGGLAGRRARPSGGGRGGHRDQHRPAGPAAGAGHRRAVAAPGRLGRVAAGGQAGRPAGRWRRPGRWAARCRGSGGRPRCRPRSRCGGCGSRWPRWSWRRRCSTGWTAGRRWIRRGTWRPGCSTTPRTAWGSGKDVPNGGPSSRCCPCYAAVTWAAGPYRACLACYLCRPRLNSAGTMTSSGVSSPMEDRPSASSVESMPPRSTSKTFLTPAEPLAASPHR